MHRHSGSPGAPRGGRRTPLARAGAGARGEAAAGPKETRGPLRPLLHEQLERLKACGFLQGIAKPTTKDLLAAGREIRERLDSGQRAGPVYTAATAQAVAM